MGRPNDAPVDYPLDGTLDLHQFARAEIDSVVREYIDACRANGVYQLRIVHGKGKGAIRSVVHAILEKHPAVSRYRHEHASGGSWGATIVDLRRME
ncbi:MAG TPA: Smr/MutS family protein [candidate division Zixibacteria bacterium]